MATKLFQRQDILERIKREFRKRDAQYDNRRGILQTRLGALNSTVDRLTDLKASISTSEQISLEAQWLINYTDDWARATTALDRLEITLGNASQPSLVQGVDGSWAPGYGEWYRKLEPTVDALQEKRTAAIPLTALTFMNRLQNVKGVLDTLAGLATSDIETTGRNNRDEQGAWLTALGQLSYKAKLHALFLLRPELQFEVTPYFVDKFTQYVWALQDEETGYWGPAYKFGNELVVVADLSFTFHLVHYYPVDAKPAIPNLDKMVATTLAIKNQEAPNGWLKNGKFTDHNNFDVVTIFSRGWKAAPNLQSTVATEIKGLVDWCVTKSLNGERFGHSGAATVDSYYYGVRFLDDLGLWDDSKCFWRKPPIPLPAGVPTATEIRENLRRGFDKVKDDSEYAETIDAIL
jgi:hypothetical protein